MQFISPYSIRVIEKGHRTPLVLQDIDFLKLLEDCIEHSKSNSINCDDNAKRAYIFDECSLDRSTGKLYGWFKTGNYGIASDIHNIETGNKDYSKGTKQSDLVKHYFQFHVRLDPSNEGICMLHGYGAYGIKTILNDVINNYLDTLPTPLVCHLKPLAYENALAEWIKKNVTELRVTKFKRLADIADTMAKFGHEEDFDTEIRVKSKGGFGSLVSFITGNSNEAKLAEVLSSFGTQVTAVVNNNGKSRVFKIGTKAENQICQIEMDESNVTMTDDAPDLSSIHEYVNDIVSEYVLALYPPS